MPPPALWPPGFAVALGACRTLLRNFPEPLVASTAVSQGFLQPVANNLGFPSFLLPSDVSVKAGSVRGVRGEWFLPSSSKASAGSTPPRADRLLVWAHGGGFVFCSPGTHRLFLARVASCSGVPVFCVDYRKPPRAPYPLPVEDVVDAFRGLREQNDDTRLFLGGDSAGGNLAIAATKALLREPEASRPASPEGMLLLSPWVDLSEVSGPSWETELDYIPANLAQVVAKMYAGDIALDDGRLSPARSKDWRGFPPVLLDYAAEEHFRCQIERLERAMLRGGVQVDTKVEGDQVHCYPLWEFAWGWGPGPFQTYFDRVAAFLQR